MEKEYKVKSSHRPSNELNRKLIKLIIERKEEMNWYALSDFIYGYAKAIKWMIDHNHFVVLGHDKGHIGFKLYYKNTVNGQHFDKYICGATTLTRDQATDDMLEMGNLKLSKHIKQELLDFIDEKILRKKEHDIKRVEEALERYVNFLDSDNKI